MAKSNTNWNYPAVALVLGLLIGVFAFPNSEVVQDNPATLRNLEIAQNETIRLAKQVDSLKAELVVAKNVSVSEETNWEALAWEQVLDEFDSEDNFYSCNGVEYRERDVEFDVRDVSVENHRNGDVSVELEIKVTCDEEDSSSQREDRVYLVSWEENDLEDGDYDEADVELA